MVPTADTLQQVSAQEDGIATERDHANIGVKVQAALEPEKVFHTVVRGEPVIAEIHQLHAGLNNTHFFLKHNSIDHHKNIGVDIVFSIKDSDNLVGSAL